MSVLTSLRSWIPGLGEPADQNGSGPPRNGDGWQGWLQRKQPQEQVRTRQSQALKFFFDSIQHTEGLTLFDLAGASQSSVSFITGRGHTFYSGDIVRTLETSTEGRDVGDIELEVRIENMLDFPDGHFDGVLMWDVLEDLTPRAVETMVRSLYRITKPGSYLFAVFHSSPIQEPVDKYHFKICDASTLELTTAGRKVPVQMLQNRSIEKVFHQFASVKFYLSRDHLREVVIRR